jgi:DNA polymerase-3 subunit delta'
MLFKDVLGQEKIKKHLIESFFTERTAHAQIFLGKEGNGALALALAYSQFLLCDNPTEHDSCGECGACRKVQKLVHPDLHFSYPTIGTKKISTDFIKEWREAILENPYLNVNQWLEKLDAENKQGNITKDECVSIVQRLSYKALEGKFKIMILWLPEYLGKEGNRLLKLIEEPRPKTVFLLISENPSKILNTILSRCQLVNIPRLEDDLIATHLEQDHNLTTEKAQTIAYLVEGNYNKAKSLLHEIDDNNAKIFVDWLRVCYQGKPKDLVQWVEAIVSGKHKDKDFFTKMGRKDQVLFLQYALYFLKEFLSLQLGGGQLKIRLQAAELSTAQNMLKVIGIEQLQQLITLFDETAFHIERNGNPRILFLDVSIHIHHILRKPKLAVI